MLSPKGYKDGAIAELCSVGVDSSGGGGAELDGGVLLHVTGVFPLPRLKLDRSPTRDYTNSQAWDIGGARRVALSSCGVRVVSLTSCLASATRAAARAPPTPGLLVRDAVGGKRGSGWEEY